MSRAQGHKLCTTEARRRAAHAQGWQVTLAGPGRGLACPALRQARQCPFTMYRYQTGPCGNVGMLAGVREAPAGRSRAKPRALVRQPIHVQPIPIATLRTRSVQPVRR